MLWLYSGGPFSCDVFFAYGYTLIGDTNTCNFYPVYLKNYSSYKMDFMHVCTYLLKLQIYDVILGGHVQSCPSMP